MTKSKTTRRALLSSCIALVLCFSMLLGTTYAWFTDSVESANNVIKSGTLDVTMEWADGKEDPASVNWTDASTGAIFNYDKWEPGYTEVRHIKIANAGTLALKYQLMIKANGVVSELADVIDVYYTDPAERITDRTDLDDNDKLGTLRDALAGMAQTASGELQAGEEVTLTLGLKMQEEAGNEYQNLAIGTDFSVILLATQLTYEEDSFGPEYDEDAAYDPDAPVAMVTKMSAKDMKAVTSMLTMDGSLVDVSLDTGYVFATTEPGEDAANSKFANWIADFVVSFDRNVTGDDGVGLAGQYDSWNTLWAGAIADNEALDALAGQVPWVNRDGEIEAGTSVRLLKDIIGVPVNYTELCNGVKVFNCGAWAEPAEDLTMTVELRLYETMDPAGTINNTTNEETGEYITIGKYSYTFEGGIYTTQQLQKALNNAEDGDVIVLKSGVTYDKVEIKSPFADNVTIMGAEGAVVKGIALDLPSFTPANNPVEGLTLKNVAFEGKGFYCENVTNSAPWGFIKDLTMDGCSFKGDDRDDVLGNRLFDIGGDSTGSHQCINLKITNCTVDTAVQGIRAASLRGECEISGNTITNVAHNGITLRSVQEGTVLVKGNTISKGDDRAFRIGVNQGTVNYVNNTISNCGDPEDNSNFKANTLGIVTFSGNTVDGVDWNPLKK